MRQITAAVAVAAASMLVAGCGDSNDKGSGSSNTSATTTAASSSAKPPVAQAGLANLMLTPAEVDSLLGVTGSKSKEKTDKLPDDAPKPQPDWKFPDECLYAIGPEAPVYAGTGFTAVSGEDETTSLNNDQDVDVGQILVLFPSAKEANDFFNNSVQRWPACADRQVTQPASADSPEITFKIGPFSNANGILSTTTSSSAKDNTGGPGFSVTIGRALTVRDNVVIEVGLMRKDDQANYAVKVAGALSDKVNKR